MYNFCLCTLKMTWLKLMVFVRLWLKLCQFFAKLVQLFINWKSFSGRVLSTRCYKLTGAFAPVEPVLTTALIWGVVPSTCRFCRMALLYSKFLKKMGICHCLWTENPNFCRLAPVDFKPLRQPCWLSVRLCLIMFSQKSSVISGSWQSDFTWTQ